MKYVNQFCYQTSIGYARGQFNIYQARNGKIILALANAATELSYNQVTDLNICIYELKEFDYDLFCRAYENTSY